MSQTFSIRLEKWLKQPGQKTIASLIQAFGEKSFAIVILVLMFFPALPIPTGGITHVFEAVVMLLALEMMAGRRTIWLPKKWLQKPLGAMLEKKVVPLMMRRIRWFERFSRPRYGWLINHPLALRLVGVLFFALALAAAIAPPFSGLDTFPSLAAVALALALILDDALAFAIGCFLTIVGLFIIGLAGNATFHWFQHLLHR
ncbi:MAG TPA: exopolysaccharide biosynthesis protein [Patescibacteria group bacterium]|nr:exopolysaccharide biosynthesis protein [Patescibacteria group bacterium]